MMTHSPSLSTTTWVWILVLLFCAVTSQGSRETLSTQVSPDLKETVTVAATVKCTSLVDTDFWGGDIGKKEGVASAAACCGLCARRSKCHRWTYATKSKRCFLKRAEGWTKKSSSGKISGRVIRETISSGTATPPPKPLSPSPQTKPSPVPIPAFPTTEGSFTKTQYGQVLGLSWLFYEAQRSGQLPASNRVSWRKTAHTKDVVPGGWYDAGDYLKLNFPMAGTATMLAWGILEFKSGYQESGQLQHALDNLYVAADYLKRCHIAPRKYIGQIGHPDIDHDFWGRAEEQKSARPAYVYSSTTGASDLMGKVAAALASSSMVFRETKPEFAADLLTHAKDLYKWGTEKPGLYSNYYKTATASIYKSSAWEDDMAMGAAWLYRATGDRAYLEAAVDYWNKCTLEVESSWDTNTAAAAFVLANLLEDGVQVPSGEKIKKFVTDTFLSAWTKSNGEMDIVKTPKGMSRFKWSKWGNLPLASNAAFLALTHVKHSTSATTRAIAAKWARSQIDYTMGSSGRSYVVGFGVNPPLRAHHAGSSCPNAPARCDWANFESDKANPQILYGALVAGPMGPGDNTYNDKRDDYVSNEVSVYYNSGFTSALAGLAEMA